jgi:hypothetical protein
MKVRARSIVILVGRIGIGDPKPVDFARVGDKETVIVDIPQGLRIRLSGSLLLWRGKDTLKPAFHIGNRCLA